MNFLLSKKIQFFIFKNLFFELHMYTSPNPIFFFFNMKTTKIIVVLNIGNRIKLNQSENKKKKKKLIVVVKTEFD